MKPVFDHEKLNVYEDALTFCGWVGELLDRTADQEYEQEQDQEGRP